MLRKIFTSACARTGQALNSAWSFANNTVNTTWRIGCDTVDLVRNPEKREAMIKSVPHASKLVALETVAFGSFAAFTMWMASLGSVKEVNLAEIASSGWPVWTPVAPVVRRVGVR